MSKVALSSSPIRAAPGEFELDRALVRLAVLELSERVQKQCGDL